MIEIEKNLISINELAKKYGLTKSTLHYYTKLGLISPDSVVGKMYIFDGDKTENKLKQIIKLRKKKVSLTDIKNKIDENNNRQ